MKLKLLSENTYIAMVAPVAVALSLVSAPTSADNSRKVPNCEQPRRICFAIPEDPSFQALPYGGELVLVTTEGSPFTTTIGKGEVSAIHGIAMSPAAEQFPNPADAAGLDWYSSPVTGTSYQIRVQTGGGKNAQQCSRIQYSLNSTGAFTQTAPPNPVFASITQSVNAQMSLVFDPNDGSAAISQIGKAVRTCYNGAGVAIACPPTITPVLTIDRNFSASQIACDQIHTPKIPPLAIP